MDNEACTGRQQKHVSIVEAVEYLERKVLCLEDLLDRVKGQGKPKVSAAQVSITTERSLESVLNTAPDEIQASADRISKMIVELEEMLF